MREHAESEFYSPEDALAAVKVMLWKKERASVPKIKQLLRASMLQHGENDWTAIFSICFVSSPSSRFLICFHSYVVVTGLLRRRRHGQSRWSH